jgi:hypothetical protein
VSVPDATTALNRGLSRHPIGSTVSRAFQGGDVLDGSPAESNRSALPCHAEHLLDPSAYAPHLGIVGLQASKRLWAAPGARMHDGWRAAGARMIASGLLSAKGLSPYKLPACRAAPLPARPSHGRLAAVISTPRIRPAS